MWLIVYVWSLYIVLSYSFNHIPPLMFQDAHVKSVKQTGLVVYVCWTYPLVIRCMSSILYRLS